MHEGKKQHTRATKDHSIQHKGTETSLLRRTPLLPPDITLLGNGKLGSLALGQRDPGLYSLTDNKNVCYTINIMKNHTGFEKLEGSPSDKCPVECITDVNHVKASIVPLTVCDDTRTPHVTSTSDKNDISRVKLDEVRDFVLLEVELDSVIRFDERVGVADSAPIMSDNVRNALCADSSTEDLAELIRSLLRRDAVDRETALDVVQQPEVLPRLLN